MKKFFFYDHDLLAKTCVNVLHDNVIMSNDKFNSVFHAKKKLLKKHQGSTLVSNSIDYFLMNLTNHNIEKQSLQKKNKIEKQIKKNIKNLSFLAAKKIKKNSEVFIHSINNQILEILKHASRYKDFKVNILEHQPHELGRHTVKKLKNIKIKHKLYPDLTMEKAISTSDICFIGAEAIKESGAIVKSGSKIVSNIARKNNCPVYVCAHSWKYDYKGISNKMLDYRYGEKNPSYIYEFMSSSYIDSYIIEQGIFKPEHAIEEIKYFNKWMRI